MQHPSRQPDEDREKEPDSLQSNLEESPTLAPFSMPGADPDMTLPPLPISCLETKWGTPPTGDLGTDLHLPGYEILGELGRGGMGVVYKARQIGLNRLCALKMILGGHAGEAELTRFRIEAEAIARLEHPNIVQVYETGQHADQPYLSLEFCPGGSLDKQLGGRPIDPRRAAELLLTLAQAVQAAHSRGIIHRDLKPANVLLTSPERELGGSLTPKITDFGLAKKLDDDSSQTRTGTILGTPSYMAPEQAAGTRDAVTTQVDVWALGAILYECLTGQPPFRGSTALDTVLQVINENPVSPRNRNAGVPRDLEAICLKCLEKNPQNRYPSAAALAEDLTRWTRNEPISVRPPGIIALVRLWLNQNFGAAGWTLAIGFACGLLLALVMWLGGIQPQLGADSQVWIRYFPNRPLPFPAFPFVTPTWLLVALNAVAFLALMAMGFATVLLVRPKNRSAELASGIITGLLTAVIGFIGGTGWWGVRSTTVWPTERDLLRISETALGPTGSASEKDLFERYPELRELPATHRGEVLYRKLRVDLVAGILRGIWLGLFSLLAVCVLVGGIQSVAAGHLLRMQPHRWSAFWMYAEFAFTSLMLLNVSFTIFLRPWIDSRPLAGITGMPYWAIFGLGLLQIGPMALALTLLMAGRRWWLRLPIQLVWIVTILLINVR